MLCTNQFLYLTHYTLYIDHIFQVFVLFSCNIDDQVCYDFKNTTLLSTDDQNVSFIYTAENVALNKQNNWFAPSYPQQKQCFVALNKQNNWFAPSYPQQKQCFVCLYFGH